MASTSHTNVDPWRPHVSDHIEFQAIRDYMEKEERVRTQHYQENYGFGCKADSISEDEAQQELVFISEELPAPPLLSTSNGFVVADVNADPSNFVQVEYLGNDDFRVLHDVPHFQLHQGQRLWMNRNNLSLPMATEKIQVLEDQQMELIKLIQNATDIKAVQTYLTEKKLNLVKDVML